MFVKRGMAENEETPQLSSDFQESQDHEGPDAEAEYRQVCINLMTTHFNLQWITD